MVSLDLVSASLSVVGHDGLDQRGDSVLPGHDGGLDAERGRRLRGDGADGRHRRRSPPVDRRLLAEHLQEALDSLAPGEREAIELAYFGSHTYREVAQILGEPEGTVKSRIRTGLLRLRDRLLAIDGGASCGT
ncbi:MAG: sigma factor-like helix-turn-helix DNA-binding protein [Deltaproteobacteria bacterium]